MTTKSIGFEMGTCETVRGFQAERQVETDTAGDHKGKAGRSERQKGEQGKKQQHTLVCKDFLNNLRA